MTPLSPFDRDEYRASRRSHLAIHPAVQRRRRFVCVVLAIATTLFVWAATHFGWVK